MRLGYRGRRVYIYTPAFSPLFFGEMGATTCTSRRARTVTWLSVPYSSGRWVRRRGCRCSQRAPLPFSPLFFGEMGATDEHAATGALLVYFQSPILRGDGCDLACRHKARYEWGFQSPILRGDGCDLAGPMPLTTARRNLSVPYSSGRWVRRWSSTSPPGRWSSFQSPILRGDGCDQDDGGGEGGQTAFQSPILRGDGCDPGDLASQTVQARLFQSPILRGDGCDARKARRHTPPAVAFQSPILRGDGCDPNAPCSTRSGPLLSVPYSSGRWVRQVSSCAFASPPCIDGATAQVGRLVRGFRR